MAGARLNHQVVTAPPGTYESTASISGDRLNVKLASPGSAAAASPRPLAGESSSPLLPLLRRRCCCASGAGAVSVGVSGGATPLPAVTSLTPRSSAPPAAPPATEYEWMVASESGALNALGFELVADVPAGHALLLQLRSQLFPQAELHLSQLLLHFCLHLSHFLHVLRREVRL